MIGIKQILGKRCECVNCHREMPLTLRYNINDLEVDLCEDCSNALVNLHYPCMRDGKSYMYHNDEIVTIEEL